MTKLAVRDPETHARLERVKRPQSHPVFRIVPGGVETWEKGTRLLPNKPMQRTASRRLNYDFELGLISNERSFMQTTSSS